MNKFQNFMQTKLGPLAAKASSNIYIQAITKGFSIILSITLIGSIATLLTAVQWEPWQNFLNVSGLMYVLNMVYNLSIGAISVYLVLMVSYNVLKKKIENTSKALAGMLTCLGCFLVLLPLVSSEAGSNVNLGLLGSQGMFTALVVGMVASTMYAFMIKHGWVVKMPKEVPEMVADGLEALIPSAILLMIWGYVGYGFSLTSYGSFPGFITSILAAPLGALQGNIWTFLLIQLFFNLLWFFGIHGGAVIGGVMQILYMPAALENVAAYAAGEPLPHIITYGFGAGTANIAPYMGIAIACLLVVKRKKYLKTISKVALVPAFFGINEPVRFGIPLSMNFFFLIPQLLYPVLCCAIFYVGTLFGLIDRPRSLGGWGIPFLVDGFMQCGISGVVAEIFCTIICVLLWIPFVKMYDNIEDPAVEGGND